MLFKLLDSLSETALIMVFRSDLASLRTDSDLNSGSFPMISFVICIVKSSGNIIAFSLFFFFFAQNQNCFNLLLQFGSHKFIAEILFLLSSYG